MFFGTLECQTTLPLSTACVECRAPPIYDRSIPVPSLAFAFDGRITSIPIRQYGQSSGDFGSIDFQRPVSHEKEVLYSTKLRLDQFYIYRKKPTLMTVSVTVIPSRSCPTPTFRSSNAFKLVPTSKCNSWSIVGLIGGLGEPIII